jgi:hypothetical protein
MWLVRTVRQTYARVNYQQYLPSHGLRIWPLEMCGRDTTVAGVLDEPYSQLIPLSRVVVQARQYGYSAELA